jgi:hypothetical protein
VSSLLFLRTPNRKKTLVQWREGGEKFGTSGFARGSVEERRAMVEAMASERQLVVVVEGTAALGPYWSAIAAEYVEKIVRYALRRLSCF